MRTRNADNPKSPPPAKKTPPSRKSATKTPPAAAQQSPSESTVTPRRASSTRGKAAATNDAAATPETPVEAEVAPGTKSGTKSGAKKTVKRVVKRTVIRKKTPASAKSGDDKTQHDSAAVEKAPVEESTEKEVLEEVKNEEHAKEEELNPNIVQNSASKEDHAVDDVHMSAKEDKDVAEAEDAMQGVEEGSDVQPSENLVSSSRQEDSDIMDVEKSLEHQKPKVDDKEKMEIEDKSMEIQEPILQKEDLGEKGPGLEKEELDKKEPSLGKVEVDENEPTLEKKEVDEKEPSLGKEEEDEEKPGSEKEEVDEKELCSEKEEAVEKEPSLEKEEVDQKEPSVEKKEMDEKENKVADVEKSVEIPESFVKVKNDDAKVKDKPDVEEFIENPSMEKEKVGMEINKDISGQDSEPVDMEKYINMESKGEEDPQERVCLSDEERDKDLDNDAHEEDDEDELAVDKVKASDEVCDELEEEHAEITAAAEDRRRRKELEIFVGGLDRDATEEEVKKAFENVGEVVEVRLHKELPTNKNKGYAFVRFAKKEQATRALSEMKNPVIHGKRCGTAPSEDNDTLFLGNICNTWTKEAIRQKLKEYGIEGVERITLVADAQHEGLSRGFAFLEFSGHPDAMLAYKRLQKPDAIFGHPERTAKVAFAEPLREPDPEVLAQVKSVFVDGLPPHWDEDTVREHFKGYGDIERIMLARNMSTAKRKDFGFVDFVTHDAAVACIDGINKSDLGDGKMKVRARLSNPLPKTQAVKGGISGGFRIGHGSGATFPKSGRGVGRGGHPSNRMNFQRGRGFNQHGRGQTSRMGLPGDYQPAGRPPHPPLRGRQNFGRGYGGRWSEFRAPHQSSGPATVPARFDVDRPRHGAIMDRDRPLPMRGQPFYPEEDFSRPFVGRHYEDPYTYGDTTRGIKRPYSAEQGPDYVEPSRGRPRLDYSDPSISVPGTRYRGGGSGIHSREYYNYDYDGAYSSYYGGDRPYGGGRPYVGGRAYGSDPPYGGGRSYGSDPPYGGGRSYGSGPPYGGGRSQGTNPPYGGRYYY